MSPTDSPAPAVLRPRIDAAEHRARQDALRRVARERGWPAVAVFGRGGGTYDRHGDLLYLTGHYQSYPYLPDRPPLWSGRGHALFALPADGAPVLVCSAPDVDPDIAVDDVRVARGDFAERCAEVLTTLGGGGIVGFDILPASLAAQLPLGGYEPAEDVLERMRRRKSPAEQSILRRACDVGTAVIDALIDATVPGTTEGAAVGRAIAIAYEAGAQPYLVALATGERAGAYTGRPLPGWRAERRLSEGELARLDLVIVLEGYYCDFGRTWVVGDLPDTAPEHALVATLERALDAAVAAAVPGAAAGAIARAGEASLPDGFTTSYPPHWGHGLGLGWEGPWLLPDADERLEPGYALAVEVALHGPGGIAAAEQDILVGPDGPELLTPARWGR